jgi:hypothetical protein
MQRTGSGRAGAGACCSRWCAAHERSRPSQGLLQHKLRGLQLLPGVNWQPARMVVGSHNYFTHPYPQYAALRQITCCLSSPSSYDTGVIDRLACWRAVHRLPIQFCPECADKADDYRHTYDVADMPIFRQRYYKQSDAYCIR